MTLDRLDPAARSVGASEARIESEEGGIQGLREGNVERVGGGHGVAELPRAGKEGTVVDAGCGPGLQVIDRLESRRAVNFSPQVHPADDPKDLGVQEMGSGLLRVGGKPRPHPLGVGPG